MAEPALAPLHGRTRELTRLVEAVSRAAHGSASATVVQGVAGVGKSWLLERIHHELPTPFLVLRCQGHPAEQDLPFAGLHQLLGPVVTEIDSLSKPQREALAAALALSPAEPAERFAAAAGLHALLTRLAEVQPVLVLVDDAHVLDHSTLEAVSFAARRLDADRVAVVLATVPDAASEIELPGGVIDLEPLDSTVARAILSSAYPKLARPVAERILEVAAGLPLALLEIPASLTPEQLAATQPLGRSLPPGRTLERLYRQRLAELGEQGCLALLVASLGELDPVVVERALTQLGLGFEDLERAESTGLISLREARVRFNHPTLVSALHNAVTESAWRRAHRALAAVLTDEPARQAWYLDAVTNGPDEQVARALASSAEEAMSRGAYAEAGKALESAAARAATPCARHTHLVAAAESYARCGAYAPLAQLLEELAATAGTARERLRWEEVLLRTRIWTTTGVPDAAPVLASALEAAAAAPAEASSLVTTLSLALLIAGRHVEAASAIEQARGIARDGHVAIVTLRLTWDIVEVLTGVPGAGGVLQAHRLDTLHDAELAALDLPVALAASALTLLDEPATANAVIERQLETFRSVGALGLLGLCLAVKGAVVARQGDWVSARASFATGAQLCADTGFTGPAPHIDLRYAYFQAALGDAGSCRALVTRATAHEPTVPAVAALACCVLGRLELTNGHADVAVEHLVEAGSIEHSAGLTEPGFSSRVGDLVEALWRLRRAREALKDVELFEGRAAAAGRIAARAIAARCRALLAADHEFDKLFAEAAALHRRSPEVFEQARTELVWGQRLRRARRKRDARDHLHNALEEFQRLGAAPWAALAKAELAACGERRQHGLGPAAELTPRELEVAVTVAKGVTNAEAAAALCVSARTIEYHLSSVYRKLGVTDRAHLPATLLS
ncbi:AAA family ATPase [Phytoactinopolyspora mesophila]|uniref:AAA family ATPase n=1 Tax=Phytoactinopolyspora mesophila TaxID=2650750 RepID=A0A7K3M2H3_9ACTN|nr:LuxR family transcriptional regulator [Phytoactinopolyspora mesophila]NDL57495.1 AAA family ATPase [Phytoactinopolyspora mesophila]